MNGHSKRLIRYKAVRWARPGGEISSGWELHGNQLIVAEEKRLANAGSGKSWLRGEKRNVFGPQQDVHGPANRPSGSKRAQLTLDRISLADSGQEVGVPDKFRDSPCGRVGIQFIGRGHLHHGAIQHDGNPVNQTEGLFLVVGDKDSGGIGSMQDVAYLGADPGTQAGIQVAEGLVEENKRGFGCKRSCESDSLLLAAAQFVRHATFQASQTGQIQDLLRARLSVVCPHSAKPELNVGKNGDVGKEGVLLEDHADAAPFGLQVDRPACHDCSVDLYGSGVDAFKSGDQSQRCRFAATGGAQQGEQFAAVNLQRYVTGGLDGGILGAKPFGYTL